jgi:hypothetical protein
MARHFTERMSVWWERTHHSLRRKWWLWPIGFGLDLVWHSVCTDTNDFLREHGPKAVARMIALIPSNPAVLAVMIGTLIIASLAVHAYFDTRKSAKAEVEASAPSQDHPVLNVPFHPHLNALGRRIESAVYGAEGRMPANVTARVESLARGQEIEIPVNHYELCERQVDPARGRDKFLTVTLSETLRQGDIYPSPRNWLKRIATETGTVGSTQAQSHSISLFTMQKVSFQPDHLNPDVSRRNVVSVVLTNGSGSNLSVWAPLWEHSENEVLAPFPLWSRVQAAHSPDGWAGDVWYEHKECLDVQSGYSFRCQIGLLDGYGDGLAIRLSERKTGTLVVPAKVDGKLKIQRIKI